jgi:hypothetical protein
MQLDAPIPHFHQGAFEAAAAEQRRIRIEPLEIPAEGDRLGNRGAVRQAGARAGAASVDRGVGVSAMLVRGNIHLLHRNLDAHLGQKNPHPPRIGRAAAVIELHCRHPRLTRSYPVEHASLSRATGPRQQSSARTPFAFGPKCERELAARPCGMRPLKVVTIGLLSSLWTWA